MSLVHSMCLNLAMHQRRQRLTCRISYTPDAEVVDLSRRIKDQSGCSRGLVGPFLQRGNSANIEGGSQTILLFYVLEVAINDQISAVGRDQIMIRGGQVTRYDEGTARWCVYLLCP